MSTYAKLLQHPKWQKKRLEVLESAGWKCEDCGEKEKPLHVHHKTYLRGAKPWEYKNTMLICLCEDCHFEHEKQKDVLSSLLGEIDSDGVKQVIGYLKGLCVYDYPGHEYKFGSYEEIVGFSR